MAILTTRVQRFFYLFFKYRTTSEKTFIPNKASAAVQALKVCPVRPRVLSSWGITLLEKLSSGGLRKGGPFSLHTTLTCFICTCN